MSEVSTLKKWYEEWLKLTFFLELTPNSGITHKSKGKIMRYIPTMILAAVLTTSLAACETERNSNTTVVQNGAGENPRAPRNPNEQEP